MPDHPLARARRSWSTDARAVFRSIITENPGLDGVSLTRIRAAVDLISSADDLAARIAEDGLTIAGSTGQQVAHPLLAEERQRRTQADAALKSLGLGMRSPASAAGAALAAKRHHRRPGSVTPIRRPEPELTSPSARDRFLASREDLAYASSDAPF